MAKYIYNRCSTKGQDYAQQMTCISAYFERYGVDAATITDTIVEKQHGDVAHDKRAIGRLIERCERGDIIYVSELSRIGRNMSDVFSVVSQLCERGVVIIQCKDGSQIENHTIAGKAILFALSLAAEIELDNIRQRTRSGVQHCMQQIAEKGEYITKKGTRLTKWGGWHNSPETMKAAQLASAMQRRENMEEWQRKSPAFNLVSKMMREGKKYAEIEGQLSLLYDANPDMWCTRQGAKVSKAHISKWAKYIKYQID